MYPDVEEVGMTQAIDALVAEHADLERQLSDPELHSNPANNATLT